MASLKERRQKLVENLHASLALAEERAKKNEKWQVAATLGWQVLNRLVSPEPEDNIYFATAAVSRDNPAQVSWAETWDTAEDDERRKRGAFAVWLKKALGSEPPGAQLLSTLYGEVAVGGEYEVRLLQEEDLLQAYYDMEGISGLQSCMTGSDGARQVKLYAQNPDVVALAVAYRKGQIMARALLWTTTRGLKVLDRVYASEQAAREHLRKWALEQGYLVKNEDTYTLVEDGAYFYDAAGKEYRDLQVSLKAVPPLSGPYWPYLDSFAYVYEMVDGGVVLGTVDDEADYVARDTDGYLRPLNDRHRCILCDALVHEDDTYWYDGAPYCDDCYSELFVSCYGCGSTIYRENALEGADQELYCDDCYHDNFTVCEECGETIWQDDACVVDDVTYCEDCYEKHFVVCDSCEENIRRDDAHFVDDVAYCERCYQELFTTCAVCGTVLHREEEAGYVDGKPYCEDCAPEEEEEDAEAAVASA